MLFTLLAFFSFPPKTVTVLFLSRHPHYAIGLSTTQYYSSILVEEIFQWTTHILPLIVYINVPMSPSVCCLYSEKLVKVSSEWETTFHKLFLFFIWSNNNIIIFLQGWGSLQSTCLLGHYQTSNNLLPPWQVQSSSLVLMVSLIVVQFVCLKHSLFKRYFSRNIF